MAAVRSIGLVTSLALGLAVAALPSSGQAATETFVFTSDHCTGGCLTGQITGGSVTITDVSSGVVSVSVSLANGNQFVNGGFDASFGFNLSGISSVTYSLLTSGWTIPGGNPQSTGALHMDGTGFFDFGVEAPGNPSSPAGSSLSFTISAAGLSVASFIQNALGQFFAADILSGTTGFTGGIDASLTSSQVPLPPAALLFGTALVGMGVLGRRRRRKDALAG